MRILQVLPALNSGGVERCVIEITDYIAKKYPNDEIFIMSSGGWMQSLMHKKCQHIKHNLSSKNPYNIIKNSKIIAEFCSQKKIDIVHVHSRAPAWSCYLAKNKAKFKLVTTVHAAYGVKGLFKKMYNRIMLKGDAVIAVSDFLKNHIMQTYRTIGKKNIFVIKRGVQISNFSREKVTSQRISLMADKIRLPDGKFTICVPARISSGKGHKELIKVLTIMKNVDFVCYFVGDFDKKIKFKKDLDKLILANKMEEKIHFTGKVEDMPAIYAISDLVILPSIKPESFGKVIIEAGSMGCIVLTTAIGNPVDIMKSNPYGFLVQPNDEIAMSRKIFEIMNLKIHHDAEKKIAIAKFYQDNYDVEKTCHAEYEIYKSLLKK